MATTDTLANREALRRAIVEDLVARAEIEAQTIEGGPLDGILVVSMGTLKNVGSAALAVTLPPPSEQYAEVQTPARVLVAAICPECSLPVGVSVTLTTQLLVETDGREIKVKASTKGLPHVCGQMALPEDGDQITMEQTIEDLRLRILDAVNDVGARWSDPVEPGSPPTLDAIATFLGIESESDRQDLEESLYAYAGPQGEGEVAGEPFVEIVTGKGHPPHYVLTAHGLALVGAAAEERAAAELAAADQADALLPEDGEPESDAAA
jgi:hypothetical protein